MKIIIDKVNQLPGVEINTRWFTEHINGVWTKGVIVLVPKEKITNYSQLTMIFREIRDKNLFENLGFKQVNQFISSLGGDAAGQFEPLRLVFSQKIGTITTQKKIVFDFKKTYHAGRFPQQNDVIEEIKREIFIFLMPSKYVTNDFLDKGLELMCDKVFII